MKNWRRDNENKTNKMEDDNGFAEESTNTQGQLLSGIL